MEEIVETGQPQPDPQPDTKSKKKAAPEAQSAAPQFTQRPTPQELDQAGAINITQFLRGENLGYLKLGFANHVKNKGIGGRKTRQEWMAVFAEFKKAPAVPFKGGV